MRRFLLVFLVANATQLRSEKTLQPESQGGSDKAVESARKNTSETAKGTDSPVDDLDVRAPWFEQDPGALDRVLRAMSRKKALQDALGPDRRSPGEAGPPQLQAAPERASGEGAPAKSFGEAEDCDLVWRRKSGKAKCPPLKLSLEEVCRRRADENRIENLRFSSPGKQRVGVILSMNNSRFEQTTRDVTATGLFSVYKFKPVYWKSNAVRDFMYPERPFRDKYEETYFRKLFSNYFSFMQILEDLQTCGGEEGKWAYVFEDDAYLTKGFDPKRVSTLLDRAEALASKKGDALMYGGVCLADTYSCWVDTKDLERGLTRAKLFSFPDGLNQTKGEHYTDDNYGIGRCAGAGAHAWAVNTSRALEIRNEASQFLRDGNDFFDMFIHFYARKRNGIMAPGVGVCQGHLHCGVFSQNPMYYFQGCAKPPCGGHFRDSGKKEKT